ncbi:unnamed protein product [Ectocarpus sp. 12 AP-2014]
MLQSAAKATQLRASLLAYTELKEMQSFAARLAQLTELKAAPMPSWWKPAVHDAHLLIASCIYGSSSDYGVDKAMKETTLAMLQENGLAFAAQEKENNKAGGGPSTVKADGAGGVAASLVPGCQSAEPMQPLAAMTNPPLTAAAAKSRIKALQTAAFVSARHHSSLPAQPQRIAAVSGVNGGGGGGESTGSSGNTDDCVVVSVATSGDGGGGGGGGGGDRVHRPVAAAATGATIAAAAAAGGGVSSVSKPASGLPAAAAATTPSTAKRPVPEVVVLDLSGDEGSGDKREAGVSESPAKKAKLLEHPLSPQASKTRPIARKTAPMAGTAASSESAAGATGRAAVSNGSGVDVSTKAGGNGNEAAAGEDIGGGAATKTAADGGGKDAAVSENGDAAAAGSAAAGAAGAKKGTPGPKTGTLDSFWSSG